MSGGLCIAMSQPPMSVRTNSIPAISPQMRARNLADFRQRVASLSPAGSRAGSPAPPPRLSPAGSRAGSPAPPPRPAGSRAGSPAPPPRPAGSRAGSPAPPPPVHTAGAAQGQVLPTVVGPGSPKSLTGSPKSSPKSSPGEPKSAAGKPGPKRVPGPKRKPARKASASPAKARARGPQASPPASDEI